MSAEEYRVYVYDETTDPPTKYSTPLANPKHMRDEPALTRLQLIGQIVAIGPQACHDFIPKKYIKRTAMSGSILFVTTKGGVPIGFVICSTKKKEDASKMILHLELICSKADEKIGGKLLDYCLEFATEKRRGDEKYAFAAVELHSLISVLSFYLARGFEFRRDCKKGAEKVDVSEEVAKDLKRIMLEAKKGRNWDTACDEACKTELYRDLIKDLHRAGLSVKQEDGCDDRLLSYRQIQKRKCDDEGYVMMYCPKRRAKLSLNIEAAEKALADLEAEEAEMIAAAAEAYEAEAAEAAEAAMRNLSERFERLRISPATRRRRRSEIEGLEQSPTRRQRKRTK